MICKIKLNVLFENPFWIGVFECEEDGEYKVSKITFGPEPKDYDVYEIVLKRFYSLKFSQNIKLDEKTTEKRINPKRMIREIRKETAEKGIGTKAQIAIKKQHEEFKEEHKKNRKERKELEKLRKFELKQMKKREKHKGH